jgi:hypothetical protein
MLRKILLGLLLVIGIIQFIRPAKNQSSQITAADFSNHYTVPGEVSTIMKKACNDCHTNNTVYPWYYNIQPVGWWLAKHVKDGKKELNFSEFGTYSKKKQDHKMEEVIETVKGHEMPLDSYTWTHKEAVLTDAERVALTDWATRVREQIAAKK